MFNTPISWTLLFDTSRDGLSMTRFESKVLGYQSPTVSIVEFNDQRSFVLGVDSPWLLSPQNWGGLNCFLISVKPAFKKFASGPNFIFFNTKLRSLDNGIIVGNVKNPLLKISGDFDNLHHMEVWGSGHDSALSAQQKQKAWEKVQAEKYSKVALPGKWEENPDKAILDMADRKIFFQQ
uniref:TLDc domain-containing protein n=1 Tax=Romanomermis culicivorax TaxID=13658 RepID=A0A915HVF1_ROMCU